MRVTHIPLVPTDDAKSIKRKGLTPELMASVGARYSRNNEGLDAILKTIDWDNMDKSVDSIFKHVDYGHQSIADMVPVSMFMDDISMILVYLVWSLCPTAGGQESSTRYIKISKEGLVGPDVLGIPESLHEEWNSMMDQAFTKYEQTLEVWNAISERAPSVMGIPESLINDKSDAAQKKVDRMRRNYAFDRSRYFLPVAAKTNFMMVMSARGWAQLCQYLLSCTMLPEGVELGRMIKHELALVAPRMLRHACVKASSVKGIQANFSRRSNMVSCYGKSIDLDDPEKYPFPRLNVYGSGGINLDPGMMFHDNRYAWIDPYISMFPVKFGWEGVAMAELRDLNRHRTGAKRCDLIPNGFYLPIEQLPIWGDDTLLKTNRMFGAKMVNKALKLLEEGDPTYLYWLPLGAQFRFSHVTTADKFIYEAELRTGVGAHFRYAQHLRDVLKLWYEIHPETKGLILEGSAEPE